MIRHWQIAILKSDRPIRLYVTTTSSMVDVDLNGDPDRSLIRRARQYHRRGQNEEQNHRDLAIGAIMAFANGEPYDISDTHVEAVGATPTAEPDHRVGGPSGDLIPIWESSVESDPWAEPE